MIHTEIHTTPFRGDNGKFYYIYKIVNNINGHYYIGIHTSYKLNDGYMGSGSRLKLAYDKYGLENFTKHIFKFFQNPQDMLDNEGLIVNDELVNDSCCYNLTNGGGNIPSVGMVVVKDETGNVLQLQKGDPRIGVIFKPINTGMVVVKTKDGKYIRTSKDDPRISTGELIPHNRGLKIMKDSSGKTMLVNKNDPRVLSGELVSIVKNTVSVVDDKGNKFRVPKNDPRIGVELHTHTENRITVRDNDGNTMSVYCNDPRIGNDLISVNFGRIYINDGKKNRMVYENQLNDFISRGWKVGMIKHGSILVHKKIDGVIQRKLIQLEELETYMKDGWLRGQGETKPKSGRPPQSK